MRLIRSVTFALGLFAASVASAQPYLLFDVNSGEVIEHADAFQRWHPASLTKLMTTFVVFRALDAGEVTLQSPIRMTRHAASMPPAKLGVPAGSVLTLDNALKTIMVKSANDVAMAIGENVGGSEEAFAARMNAEAQRLGMTGSNWKNPNGLHDPDQYTTAHDLALLVRAIRTQYPQYAAYFSIDGIVFGKARIKTFNTLMGRYPGADGMKTGFICPSGFNLIGTATRDGRTLGAVVLGETSPQTRAQHAAALLDTGFGAGLALAAASPPPLPHPTLATLQPYGDKRNEPTDMRPFVCGPPKTVAAGGTAAPSPSEASPEDAKADEMVAPPGYRPRYETVALGGATGPVPRAMLDASGSVKEDVPLPTWRPDVAPPLGAEPVALGANPPRAAEPARPLEGGGEADAPAGAAPLGFAEPVPEPLSERFGGPAGPKAGARS